MVPLQSQIENYTLFQGHANRQVYSCGCTLFLSAANQFGCALFGRTTRCRPGNAFSSQQGATKYHPNNQGKPHSPLTVLLEFTGFRGDFEIAALVRLTLLSTCVFSSDALCILAALRFLASLCFKLFLD